MTIKSTFIFIKLICLCLAISSNTSEPSITERIEEHQLDRYEDGVCLDFIRNDDLDGVREDQILQIFLIRHGEPAMDKKGWKNRKEAIRYTEMYDSVGVYPFDKMPICLRQADIKTAFTSKLPRAIDTAEKTLKGSLPIEEREEFNEFERKVIKFPNIKLPRQFWSITTRAVWIMGFNDKGIESFKEAKKRSEKAAIYMDSVAQVEGKSLLFSHGFLNKYTKRYLKNLGYTAMDLGGQEYLGAYYFFKVKKE